jgi:hypothetical protein
VDRNHAALFCAQSGVCVSGLLVVALSVALVARLVADLGFGRVTAISGGMQIAAGEDRTPDLRIMRPTRYQLRYCRIAHLVVVKFGCVLLFWRGSVCVMFGGLRPRGVVEHAVGSLSSVVRAMVL